MIIGMMHINKQECLLTHLNIVKEESHTMDP